MIERGIGAIDARDTSTWVPVCWSTPGWFVVGSLCAVGLALTGAWIAAAALVALGLGMLVIRYPQSAIYCFAFLLYTNAPVVASRFHGVPTAAVAASAGLLLIPLLYQWVLGRHPIVITPALPWIVGLVGFRLCAVLWASDRALALDSVVSTFAEGLVLYLLLTSVIRDELTLRRVVWTIVGAGALLGSLSIVQQLSPSGHFTFGGFAQTSIDARILALETPRDARSAGPLGEKNYYAQFMMFLVPLSLGLARCELKRRSRQLAALVLMALIGVWHRDVVGYSARAVLPYDQRLARLPAYLQQLDMESNGKRVRLDGSPVDRETGPLVWGEPGTNGQHAFYQLLHQGTTVIPCEFLIAAHGHESDLQQHHDLLMANCLAQSEALMLGRTLEEATALLTASGHSKEDVERLAPHKVFPGDRPSLTLVYDRLTPFALGRLIALYEHRVFVEGVIWGINSFDQWGVELGKELATALLPMVKGQASAVKKDASTRGLLAILKG